MVDESSPIAERKDYECLICISIPTEPAQHQLCKAMFCVDCLSQIKPKGSKNANCPKCNQPIKPAEQKENPQLKAIMSEKLLIAPCDEIVPLMDAEEHGKSCNACNEQNRSLIRAQVIPKEEQKQTVNRSTYKCPFCNQANLTRDGLLQHVGQRHHKMPGVCPICITYPYGDPNYMRHAYDMGEVIENEQSEEAQLMQALAASLNYQ